MKTRIISGLVLGVIVISFILLGLYVSPLFICLFVMFLAAVAAFEITGNTAGIGNRAAVISAVVYSALAVYIKLGFKETVKLTGITRPDNPLFADGTVNLSKALLVIYFILSVCFVLHGHKHFELGKIFALSAAVPVLTLGFCYLGSIIMHKNGIYYLLLMLTFSCVCDMGAYFTGVTMGKHKLCPEISPKKTVEGAAGGIISAIIVAAIIVFAYKSKLSFTAAKTATTLLLTVPFCILGMLGDLFASAVKRSVGLKDYGNLIPGHGGILDRFDSMLLIAPALYTLVEVGII